MKLFAPIAAACLAMSLAACGEDGPPDALEADAPESVSTRAKAPAEVTEVSGSPIKPTIRVPPGPPPKNLVVRDLKKGIGAVAEHGKRLRVHHVGVSYKTGEEFEAFWSDGSTFSFNFGSGEVRDGWETGLKGMRVGGRRELILPSRLAYGTGALIYIVELLAIEKPGGGAQ
jgi:peptidylprolyl isomerase